MAPGDAFRNQTALYYLYTTMIVHPGDGETAESVRRARELQSYTLNNITQAGAERGLQLTRLPKLAEAETEFQKIKMSPRHPSAQALIAEALQEISAGKLKVPSLVIWGYNDPSSAYGAGLELFKVINSGTRVSQMHVFNNSGHASYIEYPEEFNKVIVSFCGQY